MRRNLKTFILKNIVSDILRLIIVLTLIVNRGYSQNVNKKPLRLMFYNVENMFDIYDDTTKDDDDFCQKDSCGGMRQDTTGK